jgi:hypothetical protein
MVLTALIAFLVLHSAYSFWMDDTLLEFEYLDSLASEKHRALPAHRGRIWMITLIVNLLPFLGEKLVIWSWNAQMRKKGLEECVHAYASDPGSLEIR